MELTLWTYEEREGLPPDGEQGLYLGYDRLRFPFILWWHNEAGCWVGAGLDPKNKHQMPLMFRAQGDMAGFITLHAALPWPHSWFDAA